MSGGEDSARGVEPGNESDEARVPAEDDVTPVAETVEELVERPTLSDHLRRHLHYSIGGMSVLAVLVGVISAYGANAFRLAYGLLSDWLHTDGGLGDGVYQALALAAGGLVFGAILWAFRWEGFRSPAHVIVAATDGGGKLTFKGGAITAVVDAVSLGLGAAVGRYGPAVQLGATIGSQIGQRLGITRTGLRVLLGCGVAGAISASFNAPIAGAIFAHEVIIGHFRLRAFAPIAMASVAAEAVTHFHGFDYIALKLADGGEDLTLGDYPAFVLIGLLAAGLAVVYMGGITGLRYLSTRWRIPVVLQPALGGAIAGLCGMILPLVLGLGDETVQQVLEQNPTAPTFAWTTLLLLMLGKVVASVACLGLRYPGGAFSPAIFAGAMLGGAIALVAPFLQYQICVLVVMAAMMSSVVGAPIATILIVFELTENYEAATAVMVGVVAANAFVTRFFARSLFHRQIRRWGIDLDRPRERVLMERETVGQIMSKRFVAVRQERTAAELRKFVDRGHQGDVYVIEGSRRLLGKLPLAALAVAGESETAADLAERPDHWLRQSDDQWTGFASIEDFIGYSIPVVEDDESMRMVGIVSESDFIKAYRSAVQQVRDE